MIKKGHFRHNWKSRWFVLYTSRLDYFKTKGDLVPKGSIRLKGCSVISPDPEYVKKECIFRLIEIFGTEYLLQCANEKERSDWVDTISCVVRKLESVSKSSLKISDRTALNSPPIEGQTKAPGSPLLVVLQNRVTHEDLVSAMQDPEAGLSLSSYNVGSEQYKMCFTGEDLVSWLLSWAFVQSREEGRIVASQLLEKAFLHPVGPELEKSIKRTASRLAFGDGSSSLYRFSFLNTDNLLDVDFDLSESSDDSEDESILESFQGKIIKQGFLVKKGQVRHNWKVRKFVLYDEPMRLLYYSPTKTEKKGRIKMHGSEVYILCDDEDDDGDASCTKGSKKIVREHCLVIKTKKQTKYILQAPTEDEMKDWFQIIHNLIQKYKL